ncbi:MAG TPA: aldo/keto reductase [Ktedonobacteraceae bacterium]|jgi:aryl-alcohol dehydrogenase-like predicted oxidoreductase|nr:aldo/keto reductase [Ktedonobacteraceae bacterium]
MLQLDSRQLGATGIVVPAMGIGTWSWGDTGFWGYGKNYTREDVNSAFKACMDAGLNFFDTAEIYGNGESERILGECIRADGRPAIIATKFAPLPTRFSASTLLDALDASLERLGVSSIDLYQIHWPYTFINQQRLMDALARAVRSGKVRAVGVSNYNASLMRRAHARLARHGISLASNQVHYSLLHRKPEKNGVLDACRELNVSLIAYSPLEQGFLTGKYRSGNIPKAALSPVRRLMSRPARLRKIEPLLQTLESIAQERGKTIAQVALNWLLTKDDLIIPIPGAKNLRQATENAGAIGWRLTEEEFARIDKAAQ